MIWIKKSGALHEIENNEVVGAIKDLAPKANYFINMIDKALGIDAEYWMTAQMNYELDKIRLREKRRKQFKNK